MDKAEDILRRLFGRYVEDDERGLVSFFSQWQDLVGTDVAAHAEPIDIKNEALHLRVDHPAWLQRLHAKQSDILLAVQQRFPNLNIQQIHFRLAGGEGQRREATRDATSDETGRRPNAPTRRTTPPEDKAHGGEETRREAPPPPTRDEAESLERLPDSRLKESLEKLRDHLEARD